MCYFSCILVYLYEIFLKADSKARGYVLLKFYFLRIYLFIFREREKGREKGREKTSVSCLLHAPSWGPSPQPRHVPQLGIKPANF